VYKLYFEGYPEAMTEGRYCEQSEANPSFTLDASERITFRTLFILLANLVIVEFASLRSQ
jgi:hypothetical protein